MRIVKLVFCSNIKKAPKRKKKKSYHGRCCCYCYCFFSQCFHNLLGYVFLFSLWIYICFHFLLFHFVFTLKNYKNLCKQRDFKMPSIFCDWPFAVLVFSFPMKNETDINCPCLLCPQNTVLFMPKEQKKITFYVGSVHWLLQNKNEKSHKEKKNQLKMHL